MQQELTTEISLQGSDRSIEHCSNCGLEMQGAFCSRCGQATRHFIKFFPSVVREILEDTLDIDGRFGRTLATVMLRPGRATVDYLSGKRIHYTPPFRLYLFTSLLAFLMLSFEFSGLGDEIDAGLQEAREDNVTVVTPDGQSVPAENAAEILARPEIAAALERAAAQDPEAVQEIIEQVSGEAEDDDDEDFRISFSSEDWDAETNPIAVSWLPQMVNDFFNNMVGNIQQNAPRIKENPSLLIEKVIQLLPQTLFVLLPIFALLLKFFYAFSKRYYMEHLIYSVHVHTFSLMILITVGIVNILERWLPDGFELAADITQITLVAWILVYLFIAQKRVYRQGWFFTFIKYNMVYFTYTVLQIIAISLVIVIGAATL